jgi:hypothetical protein
MDDLRHAVPARAWCLESMSGSQKPHPSTAEGWGTQLCFKVALNCLLFVGEAALCGVDFVGARFH